MPVKLGQIYRDKDKREFSGNRHLLVYRIDGGRYAYCVPCLPNGVEISRRTTRIQQQRLTGKAFELIGEK